MTALTDKEVREKAKNILEHLSDIDIQDKFKVLIWAINEGVPVWEDEE